MAKRSAGILAYRREGEWISVFLVHPGGPFWSAKDIGAWSIPKGELDEREEPLAAALREFEEETGQRVEGTFHPLKPCRLRSGKLVHASAVEASPDAGNIKSNEITIEWPRRSGRRIKAPEVDRAAWFRLSDARVRISPGQVPLLDELDRLLHDAHTAR